MATGNTTEGMEEKLTSPRGRTETMPLQERIRFRAYEIWLQRGDQEGSEIGDWMQAQEDIRREIENEGQSHESISRKR